MDSQFLPNDVGSVHCRIVANAPRLAQRTDNPALPGNQSILGRPFSSMGRVAKLEMVGDVLSLVRNNYLCGQLSALIHLPFPTLTIQSQLRRLR